MLKLSEKHTTSVFRDLRLLTLSALAVVPAFLGAQLLFHNGMYGLPALISAVVFATAYHSRTLWRAFTAFSTLLLYAVLLLLGLDTRPFDPALFMALSLVFLPPAAVFVGSRLDALRRQSVVFHEESSRERLISEINTQLLTVSGADELQRLTLKYLYNVSGRASVFYAAREGRATRVASCPDGLIVYGGEQALAQSALDGCRRTGFLADEASYSSFYYLPVRFEGRALAVVGVLNDPQSPLPEAAVHTLELILLRVAVVLEKQRIEEEHRLASVERELEHMRSDFLRAISHDLRSPLTGIIGACSALAQRDMPLEPEARAELIDSIAEEAGWLLRMVENLLSVTRVGSSAPKLNKTLEPVEEVISEAIRRAEARFPQARLKLSLPDSFLMAPMDPMLIVQVLMNLIENAAKYSGANARIDVTVTELESEICFSVRDYGKGLSDSAMGTLFRPSAGRSGDSSHGMGLGLSICRSVITAHGGIIEGSNIEGGGAEFRFTLPKEDE